MLHYLYEVAFQRLLERAKAELDSSTISEEWRGWNYIGDSLRPPVFDATVSVSSVTAEGGSNRMTAGRLGGHLYHQIPPTLTAKARAYVYSHDPTREQIVKLPSYLRKTGMATVSRIVRESDRSSRALSSGEVSHSQVEGIKQNMLKLWKYESGLLSARLMVYLASCRNISKDSVAYDVLPVLTEKKVDGRVLGLSQDTSVDSFDTGNVHLVMDMKTGSASLLHKVALAGYALAIESQTRTAVDVGCIEYVSFSKFALPTITCEAFAITNTLRVAFVEKRNAKLLDR